MKFGEKKEEETLLMAFHVKEELESDIWYVDISCSNLMCSSKSTISSSNEDFCTIVSFGDCFTMKVMGKGVFELQPKMILLKQSQMPFMFLA